MGEGFAAHDLNERHHGLALAAGVLARAALDLIENMSDSARDDALFLVKHASDACAAHGVGLA